MSEYKATLSWRRQTSDFAYDSYNREHTWTFDGGTTVRASASPAYKGDSTCVDPEEALVAAVSSCQMLTFLAIAAKKRFVVDSYTDEAVGLLEKDSDGKLALTKIILRPRIAFSGEKRSTEQELEQLSQAAHDACFIANSIKSQVVIEAEIEG
jgi:organic hydroperoxide reductase OsmC/OhrA